MTKRRIIEKIVLLGLFLSAAYSITYWAVAKYNLDTDLTAVGDARYYVQMSHLQFDGVPKPYVARPLMPLLVHGVQTTIRAIGLPAFLTHYYQNVDQHTIQLDFGIVDVLALTLTAFIFYHYCLGLGLTLWESLVAVYLFFTSFYVVTYYTLPMVDSLAVFFMTAGFYAVLRRSVIGILLVFLFGLFAKETTLAIALLIVVEERRLFSRLLAAALPGILAFFIFYMLISLRTQHAGGYDLFGSSLWTPQQLAMRVGLYIKSFSWFTVIDNLQVFLFGWVLFIFCLVKVHLPPFLKRALWMMAFVLIMPLLVGVSTVGRLMFYIFPLVIPCVVLALRTLLSGRPEGKEKYGN